MMHRVHVIPSVITAWALLSLAPAQAFADNIVRFDEGAPSSAAERRTLETELTRAASSASVCFKRKGAPSVSVALDVAPNGQVTRSEHKNGGALGQCLAGVLAVHELPASGRRYKLRVSFDTRALAGGSIEDALAPYQDKLQACQAQARDRKRGGRAVVRFVITPDGRVQEPSVHESDMADSKLDTCLVDTISRARLGKGVVANKVRYALQIEFPAGGAGRAKASGNSAGQANGQPAADLQPKKDGPHDGSNISSVMNRRKDAFNQCYARQVKKNRSLAGRVVLRFTIRADGSVRNVKVKESTLGNAKVETCMVKVAEQLAFPKAAGDTRVFYPFVFTTM